MYQGMGLLVGQVSVDHALTVFKTCLTESVQTSVLRISLLNSVKCDLLHSVMA